MAHASKPTHHPEPVMSAPGYPSTKDDKLPRKNIPVIGCIDLRLTDNLVHFPPFGNPHNHFTLAGTSLRCTRRQELFMTAVNACPHPPVPHPRPKSRSSFNHVIL
jgi:hypothetical protein